ncbi:synaptic vesicle 2-related protein-like [Dendronephthya gigantea]|uniref:synaptic vesicle 2-related protein-like n=1 Tax=Dendronephthya gigantea TaxID=151771 RepID=UPI00106DB4A3|nr:synaptic vesicle 2-related protein-like [Dendronephthya gigantea]
MTLWTKFKQFFQTLSLSEASSENLKPEKGLYNEAKYKHISDEISDVDEATNLNAEFYRSHSIDEIQDEIGLRFFHWKVFLLLGFLNMTDSLEISILAVVIPIIKSEWNVSSFMAGVLTLSISSGMIAGSLFWGWVSDKYGRKRSFIGSAAFIFVFAFVSAFSMNYYWLWISLFFVGFGVATLFQSSVMIVELFPPKSRSLFCLFVTVFWTLGFLLSAVVSMELSVIGYHWALATVCFPTAIFLIGSIVFLPESPHFYLAAGDEQKALNILQDLAPEMDFSDTRLRKHDPETQRADFTQLFRSGYWKITICACIATFILDLSYYDLVYTASDVASSHHNDTSLTTSLHDDALESGHLYSVMAWMNLPEFVIVIAAALSCYVFTVKRVLLTVILLPTLSLIISLFFVTQRMPLLIVMMLSRSFLMADTTLIVILASLIYPTENRSIGVGTCFSVGRIGTLLGPFIFETLYAEAYFKGIVFNITILPVAFVATVLLPSHGATLN